jgi:T-complex protein 1 subunit beta
MGHGQGQSIWCTFTGGWYRQADEAQTRGKEKMQAEVAHIASHGVNILVNRQLVYNYPEQLLAEAGIMVIERADFEGVERLSLVAGGEIVSTLSAPDKVKLGVAI